MQIKIVHGEAVTPHIADLARLRIEVFRAFPYLYEGSEDYEASYLATYARSPESLFVLALDGARIVGASTGVPITDAAEEFRAPFVAAGVERIYLQVLDMADLDHIEFFSTEVIPQLR